METPQQRKYDIWASNALFLAFGLSVLMGYLRHNGYFASAPTTKAYVTLYLITPLTLLIFYYIQKGARGAKTLFLALYALVVVEVVTRLVNHDAGWFDTTLGTIDFVSQQALYLGAAVLIIRSLWPLKPFGGQTPVAKETPDAGVADGGTNQPN